MYFHIFKGISTKQDDEKIHNWVCDSKYKHCRPCRILWSFMLALLLEILYSTIQKDTRKLKSILYQQKERKYRRVVVSCFKPLTSKEQPCDLHKVELGYMYML